MVLRREEEVEKVGSPERVRLAVLPTLVPLRHPPTGLEALPRAAHPLTQAGFVPTEEARDKRGSDPSTVPSFGALRKRLVRLAKL